MQETALERNRALERKQLFYKLKKKKRSKRTRRRGRSRRRFHYIYIKKMNQKKTQFFQEQGNKRDPNRSLWWMFALLPKACIQTSEVKLDYGHPTPCLKKIFLCRSMCTKKNIQARETA